MEKSLDDIIGSRSNNRRGSSRVGKPRHNRRGHNKAPRGKVNQVKVTNLDPDLTEDDISGLFSKAGEVSNVDLKINTQGVSTGVAFIDFSDANAANRAVDMFHMRLAVGKTISVTSTASLSDRMGLKQQPKKEKKPKREEPVSKTAEDLDNELSLYMAQQQEQQQQQEVQQPVTEAVAATATATSEEQQQPQPPHEIEEDLVIDE